MRVLKFSGRCHQLQASIQLNRHFDFDLPKHSIALLLAVVVSLALVSCGGSSGGGSGGFEPTEADFSAEYASSGALEPINAQAAYSRGFTGGDTVVHLIGDTVPANDSRIATNIERQYLTENGITRQVELAPIGTSEWTDRDSYYRAYLVSGHRDGRDGHGVAYNSSIFAYDLSSRSYDEYASLVNYASENNSSDIMAVSENIKYFAAGLERSSLDNEQKQLSSALYESFELAMEKGHVIILPDETRSAVDEQSISAEKWDLFKGIEDGLMVAGSVYNGANLTSLGAGPAKESYLVAPNNYSIPAWYTRMVGTKEVKDTYDCIFIIIPAECERTRIVPVYDTLWEYDGVSGTNYAAAVVSGGAAVLRSAFPYLTAKEIKSLLLSTADDLGDPGVDDVYGHGLMNLDRATQPVGELTVASTDSVDGGGAPAEDSFVNLGPAFGDALIGAELLAAGVAFDGFGRPYTFGLEERVTSKGRDLNLDGLVAPSTANYGSVHLAPGYRMDLNLDSEAAQVTWSTALEELDETERPTYGMALTGDLGVNGSFRFGLQQGAGSILGVGSEQLSLSDRSLSFVTQGGANLPQFGLITKGAGASINQRFGDDHEVTVGWISDADEVNLVAAERQALQVISRHRLTDGLVVGVGAGLMDERGTFLASESGGAFGDDSRSQAAFSSLLARYEFAGEYGIEGHWTAAVASPNLGSQAMLDTGQVRADSWGGGLFRSRLFSEQDRLGIRMSQPFRVADADGQLSVPVGRDFDGNVIRSRQKVDLEPSGREIDLEVAYRIEMDTRTLVSTNLFLRHEPGHDAGAEPDLGLLARVARKF